MKPPVALLVYAADEPRARVFYPFAEFSPEWQAIRYALARGVPVRFMDLPQTAPDRPRRRPTKSADGDRASATSRRNRRTTSASTRSARWPRPPATPTPSAGGSDEIERRRRCADAVRRRSTRRWRALRDGIPTLTTRARRAARRTCARRSAPRSRRAIERIAVVCGAWHAPALAELGAREADAALLKGCPKTKVAATWVPWTARGCRDRSGYGAGVDSPGWYEHSGHAPEQPIARWLCARARLLREEDLRRLGGAA